MCLPENHSNNANQLKSVYVMGTIAVNGLTGSDNCLKSVISEINLISGSDIDRIYPECTYQAHIYLFKLKNEDTRTMYETCSKLTMKTPEQRH